MIHYKEMLLQVVKRLNQQKSINVKQDVIKSTDHFFSKNEEKVIEKVKKYCFSFKSKEK